MKEMSKARRILMTLTIWFTSFSVMYSMLTVVIANDLYMAFPEGEFFVTASLSWPFLLVAFMGLLSGALLKKLSTKQELIIAGIFILAGLVPRWVNTAEMVLVFVMLQGVGAGFANTAGMALISEVFTDEAKRSKQMGYYNFIMAIMGVIISFGGGVLAVNGWQFAYDIYWIALPMLVMTILFLPNIKPEEHAAESADGAAAGNSSIRGIFTARFTTFFVASMLWSVVWCLFQAFSSVYVAENALGDVSFAGTCTSLTTVGSAICCVAFGFFFPKLRRKVLAVSFIVCAIAYAALWLAPSVPVAIVASLAGGGCYGTMFTVIYAYGAACVSAEQNGFTMGLMTFCYAFASSIGVYFWSFVMGATGTVTAALPIGAVILVVIAVVDFIQCRKDDKEGFLLEGPAGQVEDIEQAA